MPFQIFNSFHNLGTGKTKTLIAAIKDLVRTTNKFILVCAQSNTACDELMLRTLKTLEYGESYRMYAVSVKEENIPLAIRPLSNLHEGRCQMPALNVVYQPRVVICTVQTAGYFNRVKSDPHFDLNHFSFLMIDEAGSIEETGTLIPITGNYVNL